MKKRTIIVIQSIDSILEHIEPMMPVIIPQLQFEKEYHLEDFSKLPVLLSGTENERYGYYDFLLADVYGVIAKRCKTDYCKSSFDVLSKQAGATIVQIGIEHCKTA
jgi:hypothetical protein